MTNKITLFLKRLRDIYLSFCCHWQNVSLMDKVSLWGLHPPAARKVKKIDQLASIAFLNTRLCLQQNRSAQRMERSRISAITVANTWLFVFIHLGLRQTKSISSANGTKSRLCNNRRKYAIDSILTYAGLCRHQNQSAQLMERPRVSLNPFGNATWSFWHVYDCASYKIKSRSVPSSSFHQRFEKYYVIVLISAQK